MTNTADTLNTIEVTVPLTRTLPHAAVAADAYPVPLLVVVQSALTLSLVAVIRLEVTENWLLPASLVRLRPDVARSRTACNCDCPVTETVPLGDVDVAVETPPIPERCRTGLVTGWLKATVIVPRPEQVPVEAQVPVFANGAVTLSVARIVGL
ncbi:hypothetical protein [Micropruina sp.]|uniref:hypothetical protein n=1 Tax=Micropruina sp. TaxID=2737536 RepID=UPI0039E30D34